jgi:Amidohydrolase family
VPRDAYFAAIAEARARGVRVVGRVPRDVRIQEAADAGLRTFERMSGVPLPCPFSVRLLSRTPGLSDVVPPCGSEGDRNAVFAELKAQGAAVTPTLVSFRGLARADERGLADDPEFRYAAPALRATWQRKLAKWPRAVPTSYRRDLIKLYLPTVSAADRAGVRIVAGSDLGSPYVVPGFAIHDEMQLLVQAGLSPLEALQAATRNAAAAAGEAGSVGTIEPGQQADLVLLTADPLADIRNTERIEAVVLHGRLLDRAALDRLLGR